MPHNKHEKPDLFGDCSTNNILAATSSTLKHCRHYRRPWKRETSKVPSYFPYSRYPDRQTEDYFLPHIHSMPALSPSPAQHSSLLSHSASDIPNFNLDEKYDNDKEKGCLTLNDLEYVQMIGTGMYSKVYLVQSKKNCKDFFALKVIPRYKVSHKKLGAKTEAEIMLSLDHPLIVKTWNTFEDDKNVYMLMDFATGGELFYHLRETGRFDEDTARFYAAEVVLALEYLHSKNIAYRDLKLENLVLSDKGHVNLTDFGFAKYMDETKTSTLCGTPEYLAPEIIRGNGYDLSVDWWALGVLLFEMLAGYSPFYSDSPIEIYKNILRGSVRFSSCMSDVARDLLKGLLARDSTTRLGVVVDGVSEIRNHPFFAGIDWKNLANKVPPIIPDISGRGDTKYFKFDEERTGADVNHESSSDDDDDADSEDFRKN
jgi:serine/threonine protein kinase